MGDACLAGPDIGRTGGDGGERSGRAGEAIGGLAKGAIAADDEEGIDAVAGSLGCCLGGGLGIDEVGMNAVTGEEAHGSVGVESLLNGAGDGVHENGRALNGEGSTHGGMIAESGGNSREASAAGRMTGRYHIAT